MTSSLGRQIGMLAVGRTLAFAVTFAIPLIVIREFTQSEFGLYKQLFLIQSTLTGVLSLGLPASLLYFLPSKPESREGFIIQTLGLMTLIGTVGAAMLVLLAAPISKGLNNPEIESYAVYLGVLTLLTLVADPLELLMLAHKQAGLSAVTAVISESLRGVLMIGAVVTMHSIRSLVAVACIWAACRLIALIIYVRRVGVRQYIPLNMERLKVQWLYALPFGMALIARNVTEAFPQYLVAYLHSPAIFALYSIGYLQIPIVPIAVESISEVTLVHLSELRANGLLNEAVSVLGSSVLKICFVLFPLYAWLLPNADSLIAVLFGEGFQKSADIFRIFLLAIPLAALGLDYVPRAFADTQFVLRVNLIRLALTVSLVMILANIGDLVGIAAGTIIAIAITKLLILQRVSGLLKTSIKKMLPWQEIAKLAVVSGAAGCVVWLAKVMLDMPPVTQVICSVPIFGVCYGGLVLKTNVLPERVRELIGEWARSVFVLPWIRKSQNITGR